MLNNSAIYLKKLTFRYHQFGGWRLVRAYLRLGIVLFVIKQLWVCFLKRKPFKTVYPLIGQNVCEYLTNRYSNKAKTLSEKYHDGCDTTNTQYDRNKIWFCWMQGLENAPELVKACYNSIKRNLPDYDVTVITKENYSDYVLLPDFIIHKYTSGILPHAMFTDLIRLELLIKFGGTWIDSTVLCTNGNINRVHEIMHSPLFVFQYRNNRTGKVLGISNWFISADRVNPMLCALRDMLYQYWNDHDCVVYYFVFHYFFMMLSRYYPEYVENMPRISSKPLLMLDTKMNDDLDMEWYEGLTSKIPFHKLNYRVEKAAVDNMDSTYHHIIQEYCE